MRIAASLHRSVLAPTARSTWFLVTGVLVACSGRPAEVSLSPIDRTLVDHVVSRLSAPDPLPRSARPAWVNDQHLVYTDARSGSPGVHRIGRDGRGDELLVAGRLPVPDPSGESMAFLDLEGRLALMKLSDRSVTTTAVRPASWTEPYAWSAQGEVLAVATDEDRVELVGRDGQLLRSLQASTRTVLGASLTWLGPEQLVWLASAGEDSGNTLVVLSTSSGATRTLPVQLGIVLEGQVWPVQGGKAVRVLRNVLDPQTVLFAYHYELIEVDVETGASRVVIDAEQWLFTGVSLFDGPAAGEVTLLTRRAGVQYVLRTLSNAGQVTRERPFPLQFVNRLRQSPDGRFVAWIGEDLDDRVVLRVASRDGAGPIEPVDLMVLRDERPPGIPLADVAAHEWTTRDGVKLGGLVFTPAGAAAGQPLPLWVDVHGGPEGGIAAEGSAFQASVLEWHHRAAQGYVVFVADYRSGGVAGLAARLGAPRPIPVAEQNDVFDGIDALARTHRFDEKKVVLFGHSAGGSLTQFAVTNSGRPLAAAFVKESGFTSFGPEVGEPFVYWFGEGNEGAQRRAASDPVLNAARVSSPVMFLGGSDEEQGGSAGAMQVHHEAIERLRRVEARLVSFEGEGHVFEKPETFSVMLFEIGAFLERAAGIAPATPRP